MSNKKATKRALLTSILAICLCLVMLIGSTFAWFTSTASTGVNTITAGNLHVAIRNTADTDDLTTLDWVKAANAPEGEKVLWEPGCTYELTPFVVKNTGSLALKYKLVITGLDGDSELLDVIKFSVKMGDAADPVDLENFEGRLIAANTVVGEDETLQTTSELITVSATMDPLAGNDYMNKTLNGVKIEVYATQDTVEYDSTGNQYDAGATGDPDYPDWTTVSADVSATVTENEQTVLKNTDGTISVTYPAGSIAQGISSIKLSVKETNAPANLDIPSDAASKSYAFKVTNADTGDNVFAQDPDFCTVQLFVGKGLNKVKMYAGSGAMTESASPANINDYKYDAVTGMVTFCVKGFGNDLGTITYVTDGIQEQLDNAANGTTITLTANKHYDSLYIKNDIDNLTIKGAAGAVVGRICINGNVTISNLTIDGVNFVVSSQENAAVYVPEAAKVNGLMVENCTMTPAAGAEKARFVSVTGSNQENVSVKNCKVSGAFQAVTVNAIQGLIVSDNSFTNITGRDIMIMAGTSGSVTITNNKSDGSTNRFLRIGDASQMTSLIVTDNMITNFKYSGYFIEIDTAATNATFSGNSAACVEGYSLTGTGIKMGEGEITQNP